MEEGTRAAVAVPGEAVAQRAGRHRAEVAHTRAAGSNCRPRRPTAVSPPRAAGARSTRSCPA
ncbi:hypothetical protein ACFQV8_22980 [Pseudonocardia benzenivorans]